MQFAEFERKNPTLGRPEKNKNSVDHSPLDQSSLEGGGRVSAIYAALAGLLLRGAEGLSDRRAERRMRYVAKGAARNGNRAHSPADR